MREPTKIFGGVEIDEHLCRLIRQLPRHELDEFLQRCKFYQYTKIDGAQTDEERLTVQIKANFVDEFRNFFKSLLTTPQQTNKI
jgi:hypothetical protein